MYNVPIELRMGVGADNVHQRCNDPNRPTVAIGAVFCPGSGIFPGCADMIWAVSSGVDIGQWSCCSKVMARNVNGWKSGRNVKWWSSLQRLKQAQGEHEAVAVSMVGGHPCQGHCESRGEDDQGQEPLGWYEVRSGVFCFVYKKVREANINLRTQDAFYTM